MFFQQQTALKQLLFQRRTKELTRRTFLKRASEIGLLGSLATILLESCDSFANIGRNTSHPVDIVWQSEDDKNGTFGYLVKKFNQLHPDIRVTLQASSTSSCNPHDDRVYKLSKQQPTPEVLSLDVVWMHEFASHGWIEPLEARWLKEETPEQREKDYLSAPLKAVSFDKHIWAAPFHTDIGLLYYRKDITSQAPETWNDLKYIAKQAMKNKKVKWGYTWQGGINEALVCNLVEVLSGYGATIFDPAMPQKVVINEPDVKPKALAALQEMMSWVGTISPPNVTTYKEYDSITPWLQGNVAFLRVWPNVFAWSNDASKSQVVQKFDVAPLPASTSSLAPSQSCLGGWQLALNNFASLEKKEAAWQFIWWMLQEEAQQYMAVREGFPVTLRSIYNDQDVQAWNALFARLPLLDTLLGNAQLRPVATNYPQIADAIERRINSALAGLDKPEQALQKLQTDLESIVSRRQQAQRLVCSSS